MIEEWLEKTIGDIKYNSSGTDVAVCCPFCEARRGSPDDKYHMYVSVIRPVAICHRCDWSGTHLSLVMEVDGCTYIEALSAIQNPKHTVADYDKVFRSVRPTELPRSGKMSQPPGYIPFLQATGWHIGKEARIIWNYITHNRGVPIAYALSSWGYVPGSNRAWVLIDNTWWQGRSIFPNAKLKYISPPWPKGDSLWNAKALYQYNIVDICEGVISATHDGDNAVALCGKTVTDLQAERLSIAPVKTYRVMLDSDAKDQSYVIAEKLRYFGYIGCIKLCHLQDGDPADHVPYTTEPYDFVSEVRHKLGAITNKQGDICKA